MPGLLVVPAERRRRRYIDTPARCYEVGGGPGESVWGKTGTTAVEPHPIRDGYYLRMNIDVGSQSGRGAHAVVLGDSANSKSCDQARTSAVNS